MRIVSLLPSATELVCGLGLRDNLVGVSHECDYPASVVGLPVLTSSRIPANLDSATIDHLVTEQLKSDEALYSLDVDTLVKLEPDLIVTQALCDVCAVSGNDVARAVGSLPGNPQVINLEPECLEDVLQTVQLVAQSADCEDKGNFYLDHLRKRISIVEEKSSQIPQVKRPKVALLDWLDPLFDGGHWSPEIIQLAGGEPCFGCAKTPSQRRTWSELQEAAPDMIFIALCGFGIDRSMHDVTGFLASIEFEKLHQNAGTNVFLVDGNAYFSRPGPRLVDALEIMANAIHPSAHQLPDGLASAISLN